MLNTVHVTAAAAIVVAIPNPWFSLPLALASHLILDTIPHWNWSPGRTLAGKLASVNDGLLAIIVSLLLAWYLDKSWVVLAACFLSMLPDLIQAPYHFFKWQPHLLAAFINWERQRQRWPWMKPWMGIATQLAVLIISFFIVFSV